jgi:hypothetical protein
MSKHLVIGTLLFLNGLAWLAGSPVGAAGNGSGGPYGSTFDFELLAAEHSSAVGSYYRLSTGPGSFTLHFDGTPESLPSYCCGLATTPSVNESFTDNGDGTSTVEIIATSPNGTDLYPSGMLGEGNVPETDAGLRIGHPHGFFSDSIPLTWSPPHAVLSATVDLKLSNGTSVYGGPYVLSPATFFGAPGPWGGSLAVVFPNQVGKGITSVDLRIVVPSSNSGGGACVADATTLCLSNSRFKVKVAWQALHLGTNGTGQAVPLTSDTGYFWFFGSSNVELVIKVVDGTPVNGHFWVFYGALSNVQYTITVTDTKTGLSKTYFNSQDTLASVADTAAFSASSAAPIKTDAISVPTASAEELLASAAPRVEPAATAQLASGCTADASTLCLSSGRFKVKVAWQALHLGTSGTGQAVPLTSDTGYFWFFGSSNVELIIKVVDGTPVNGKFWVFYGALSNVQYTITVTDTETGLSKTYFNPQDTLASMADTAAFSPGGTNAVTLVSLGATTANPFMPLTLTGTGFDPANSAISVRFSPGSGGAAIVVPVSWATPTTVQVMVPPLLDAISATPAAGVVDVQVIQFSGHTILTSNHIAGLQISAPTAVPPEVAPGAMTSTLINAALNVSRTIQAAAVSDPSLATVSSALDQYNSGVIKLAAAINTITDNPSQSVTVTLANGATATLDATTLRLADQFAQGMVASLVSQGQLSTATSLEEGFTMASIEESSASSNCPTSATDPTAYDTNVCFLQRFFQNLSGANPAVNDAEKKLLMNIGLGAIGDICFGEMAIPFQLGWGALSPFITSYAMTHSSPAGTEVFQGLGASALDVEAKYGSRLPDRSGSILDTTKEFYKVIKLAATTFPPTRGIVPSSALVVNDYAGNSYLIFPDGFQAVRIPAAQGSFDSRQLLIPPGQTYELSVSVSDSGLGSVSSFPSGITCGSACTSSYPAGNTVMLTANPTSTSLFQGWSGACTGADSCVVTMNTNNTVAATFAGSTVCTYTYSAWSPCQPDNTQTRTVISSSPPGCIGTPVLSQSCTYAGDPCHAYYYDVYCTVFGGLGGCWHCHDSNYSGNACPSPWPNAYFGPGVCVCGPSVYTVCE